MSSHRVKVRVAAACSVRLKYGTDPDVIGGAFTSPVAVTAAPYIAEFTLTGLNPGTKYYARTVTNGQMSGPICSFTPVSGISFSFATASCSKSLSTSTTWVHAAASGASFFLHSGDFHYENPGDSDTVSTVRGFYDTKVLGSAYRPYTALLSLPIEYIPDGHDFYVTDLQNASTPYVQQVIREYFPMRTLPDSAGLYRAFTIGRVRFIITDLYSYRSDFEATDNSSKTMLGATQKAWFKRELLDAESVHGCLLTLWVNTWPLVTSTLRWGKYSTERAELVSFIAANVPGHVAIISGDDHAISMDDGTATAFLGTNIPLLQSAPMDQTVSRTSTGPYSEGTIADSARSFFTLVTIDDDGTDITMTWSGRDETGAEVMALTTTWS